MTLLDAYALVALVGDEQAAGEVDALLREGGVSMTSINLGEALDVLGRVHQLPAETLETIVGPLCKEAISVIAPGELEAWDAAELRARHHSRRRHELSLADCFLLASASTRRESIATADPAVAASARAEGIDVVALPDRQGVRP